MPNTGANNVAPHRCRYRSSRWYHRDYKKEGQRYKCVKSEECARTRLGEKEVKEKNHVCKPRIAPPVVPSVSFCFHTMIDSGSSENSASSSKSAKKAGR